MGGAHLLLVSKVIDEVVNAPEGLLPGELYGLSVLSLAVELATVRLLDEAEGVLEALVGGAEALALWSVCEGGDEGGRGDSSQESGAGLGRREV